MQGKVPCITPAAKLWLRRRRRLLSGDEKLALQGVNMQKFAKPLQSTSEGMKCKLAGNAFSFHCFTVGFISALTSLPVVWTK